MLIEGILQEFNTHFEQDPDHDTILWFDPHGEWHGLLPHLASRLLLRVFEGSQLRLRYELAKRQPGERTVVYLPMEQEEARYLRPYFYTSKCYQPTIEKVLRDAGVNLPADPKVVRQLRPFLPALAVASVGKGRAFWEGIVNLETALGRLIADFDDTLLRLLTDPRRTVAALHQGGLAEPFAKLVTAKFGIQPPEPGREDAWADRFTALLCLIETYASAQCPASFPFADVLPQRVYWDRYRGFLRKWQHHELFKTAFRQRAKSIDAQYQLGSWVATLSSPPPSSTFLNVEKALWKTAQRELEAIRGKAEAVEFARQQQGTFQGRAKGFWAREGEMPGWRALARMTDTILGAQATLDELTGYTTPADMIEQYAREWWKVDRSYRRFRTELDTSAGHLDAALRWTARIYHDYLEQVNSRFTEAVTQEGTWPPAGQQVGLTALWDQPLGGSKELQALVIVDALRYELAQDLAERLEVDSANVSAHLSAIPSVTALGMAALLPRWPEFKVDYAGDGWIITPPDTADNLATKSKRLAWLAQQLGSVVVFDLSRWLSTPLSQLAGSWSWIVVTSSEIDAIGEGAGTVALHTFDSLLGRLEHGVRRLLAAGCTEIHIVADHGFLLREAVREPDKVKVNVEGILKKHERYLIGRDLPPTDLPHLPVSGSRDLIAWFPRGIGCFVTRGPYNYMHGGIALQEVVTPHIQVRQSVAERLVGVALQLVDGPEIRNAIFKVHLMPKGVDLLARPRQVEIDIVRHGERVSRVWEERVERDVIERSLMLEPDYGVTLGDRVQIRVRDTTTGELLDEQPAVIRVDLDL
jgi:hypothetical protein